jgi:hypothetical protein
VKTHYKTGDLLCDMHDGFKYLPRNLQAVAHIRLATDEAVAKLAALLPAGSRATTNKLLIVIGETPAGEPIAAYSYDGRTLGIVHLRLTQQ